MMGSEVATIAAVESTRPAENIARAVRTVALRILIFYVLSIAVVIAIVPWRTLPIGFSPFIIALNAMHIPGAAPGDVGHRPYGGALLPQLRNLHYLAHAARTCQERGRAAILRRHRRQSGAAARHPFRQCVGFLAATASIISPNGVFLFLINTSGAIILMIYMIIALGEIRLRHRLEREGTPGSQDVALPVA
jgi:GABA permease